MTTKTMLEPNRDQLEIFTDAVLRHRGEEGYLSLRAFYHEPKNKPFQKRMWTARLSGSAFRGLIDHAVDMARRSANNPQPVVFCPPLAVFNAPNGWQAREEDLFKGLALSVECDSHPEAARQKLQEILGPATGIVRSGGQWINGDDRAEDKLHLHWRLKKPGAMGDALPKLKQARELATRIVGGDTSNITAVHPIRWPGSWHRKGMPRLCELISVDPDREIDLDIALTELLKHAPPDAHSPTRTEPADTHWRELNERALANLDIWVRKLFPTAKKNNLGYRVPSADLGRGRQEDLSLTSKGIKYFGDHDMGDPRQGRRSPLDVVMEWNHVDLLDAARWLERALDQPAPQEPSQGEPAEDSEGHDQAETEAPQNKSDGHAKQYRFTLKRFASIAVSPEPNYLVKSILPRTGLVVVWGPPKCGKSFWTFDLVMHVAIGREYRGHRVRQGTVVYLALEGGAGFAGRVEAWRRRCLGEHDQAVPFFLLDAAINLVADHAALIADIRAQLGDTSPTIIVIDTLNRSLPGSESDDKDMSSYIRAADAVRAAFGCLVLIIHHCGIAGNRPRGHTSLAGADDAQIAVERDKDGTITATVEHAKDFEAGAKLACTLERVELGNDTDGDPLSSCVVIPTAGAAGPKLSKTNTLAFDLLKRLLADRGETPAADLGLPPGYCVVKQAAWREAFYGAHPSDKPGSKQKAFVRAHMELYEQHLIEFHAEFVGLRPDNPDI